MAKACRAVAISLGSLIISTSMPEGCTVSACVIIIGNEISGRTHDANLPYLAALNGVGIRVMEVGRARRRARHHRGGERLPGRL